MQWLVWILCSMTLLYSGSNKTKTFSEKLIVSVSKEEKFSQESLLKLKVYFIENPRIGELREKYNLELKIERWGEYSATTIKPIESLSLRNELLILLSPIFKDIFFINYKPKIKKVLQEKLAKPTQKVDLIKKRKKKKVKSLISEIGLQWLVLLLLSVIGLVSSLLSRKKMLKLDETQEDLKGKQKKIETEIKNLGVQDA